MEKPSPSAAALLERIQSRKVVVGIIGLGYVGLPLALRFAECGVPVIGFDIDTAKIETLNAGRSYINYLPAKQIQAALADKMQVTSDFSRLPEADALLICVPTPLGKHREPDLSYVLDTTRTISRHLRAGQLIALESTTYPGTTEDELKPLLETSGLQLGRDIFLVYSPERQDPGNPTFGPHNIPKVVGGCTPTCLSLGEKLYSLAADRVVPVSSPRVAELSKLLENIHRAVNIGLVNEMKVLADRMGIDIFEVIRTAATKPFGFVPYYPGPGLGGHCIPVDPFYLTWKAREYGLHTRFIELAGEVNSSMPHWVVLKVAEALNDQQKAMKGARILMLGIAYKRDVDDLRESPAMEMLDLMTEQGAQVDYHDPLIPKIPAIRRGRYDMESTPLTPEALRTYDAVLIATDHSSINYDTLATQASLIVDTRGRLTPQAGRVIRA